MWNKNVLLVEDQEDDAFLISKAIRYADCSAKVFHVGNAQEALAYLTGKGRFANRELYPVPKLLIADIKMPKTSGFEMLKVIRQSEQLKRMIFIVLSSSNDQRHIDLAYELGANCYIVKPSDFQTLQGVCNMLLSFWLTVCETPDRPPLTRHENVLRRSHSAVLG